MKAFLNLAVKSFRLLLCKALPNSGLKLFGTCIIAGQGRFALNTGLGDGGIGSLGVWDGDTTFSKTKKKRTK